jgi:putative two-component system response regulator
VKKEELKMAGDRKKIFIVDDNPEILNSVKSILKDTYMVYPNPSAQDMFELLEHVKPDLILLDVEMPGMNGYEAIKKLKNNDKYREIPVIFLTSISGEETQMVGFLLSAADYIQKPFVTPVLLERIQKHI